MTAGAECASRPHSGIVRQLPIPNIKERREILCIEGGGMGPLTGEKPYPFDSQSFLRVSSSSAVNRLRVPRPHLFASIVSESRIRGRCPVCARCEHTQLPTD